MIDWMILPFKRYAEFSGRSRRMEYWSFALFTFLVMMVLMLLGIAMGVSLQEAAALETGGAAFGGGLLVIVVLAAIFMLAILVPSIAVTMRRLHDRNLSGWWYLGYIVASMIPLVNFVAGIAFLVVMFLPGTPGPNQYGPDPKDPGSADVFA